jgi:hypothetical protein
MWTPDTRLEYDRDGLRYPGDLTGEERQILSPLLPPPPEPAGIGPDKCAK